MSQWLAWPATGAEALGPCGKAWRLEDRVADAEAIVVGRIAGLTSLGDEGTRARIQVEQYVKGGGPLAIDVGGWAPRPLTPDPVTGHRYVLFLEQNETGEGLDVMQCSPSGDVTSVSAGAVRHNVRELERIVAAQETPEATFAFPTPGGTPEALLPDSGGGAGKVGLDTAMLIVTGAFALLGFAGAGVVAWRYARAGDQ